MLKTYFSLLGSLLLISCSPLAHQSHSPTPSSFLSTSDGKVLALQHWNLQPKPATVLIGLHGIEGAARDFRGLGKALPSLAPHTALYALNLRGAGYDPELHRQGDIKEHELWIRDLHELHANLRCRHPQAKIVWIGESMGALISLKAATDQRDPPEGLILLSPVISLDAIPKWQRGLLKTAAFIAPSSRFSLETLAGGSFQATTSSDHFSQNEKNEYHVESYTLRFLREIATLSEHAHSAASQCSLNAFILHGAKDSLSTLGEINRFAKTFSPPAKVQHYSHSHHLLFYDKDRHRVIDDICKWITHQ